MIKISPIIRNFPQEFKNIILEPLKKYSAVVCPIYVPDDGSEPQFILFRCAQGAPRYGLIEFPGGTREPNESLSDTAARECLEETCGYLSIPKKIIDMSAKRKIMNAICHYVQVPLMTNSIFIHNVMIEKNKSHPRRDYLEMDRLIRIPISNFYKNGIISPDNLIFPKTDISVTSVYGKEYKMWKISAMCAFSALRGRNSIMEFLIGN